MLQQHIIDLQTDKQQMLCDVGLVAPDQPLMDADALKLAGSPMRSTPKFCAALEQLGVTIEYKTTPTGRQAPALAKTDEFMGRLQEHPDPRVQTLAATRLGVKSTIEESRAQRMLSVASLDWAHYRDGNVRLYSGGTMPIPLRYAGAHTHRLSGDWKMNMQNLPTMRGSKGRSKLRLSLLAPPGHYVLVADLGQIEARLVAWICGCLQLIQQFEKYDAGDKSFDPYNRLGSAIFGFPVDRKIHKVEGFIGKTGILGLGYGAGDIKFFDMVLKLARALGEDISGIRWSQTLATMSVMTYRSTYHQIPGGWTRLSAALGNEWLGQGRNSVAKFGPVTISKGTVHLPSGLSLNYAKPQKRYYEREDKNGVVRKGSELVYQYGRTWHKIYGAKMLENIVQALARIILTNAKLRINDRFPIEGRFALQAHDELVYIVTDQHVDKLRDIVHQEMTRRPSWAPTLPLKVESKVGRSYGDCK
jgi:DNA polymerase